MTNAFKLRRALLTFGTMALVLFLGYFAYDYLVNEPVARVARSALEAEMARIEPFPGATFVEQLSTNKTQRALVSCVYSSAASFEDIRKHYEQELDQSGWVAVRAIERDAPGANTGEVVVSYCRENMTATLRYHNPANKSRWTYAFDLSWWIRGCDPA